MRRPEPAARKVVETELRVLAQECEEQEKEDKRRDEQLSAILNDWEDGFGFRRDRDLAFQDFDGGLLGDDDFDYDGYLPPENHLG